MRTISFNTHDEDLAADTIAKMLLDLPHGGESDHIQFDPDGTCLGGSVPARGRLYGRAREPRRGRGRDGGELVTCDSILLDLL
jgi:hypothetical protein